MKPIIIVTHAAFDEARQASIARLLEGLTPCPYPIHIERDETRQGSIKTWLKACIHALNTDATHIIRLPDDCTVIPEFNNVLPTLCDDRIVDMFPNHPKAPQWLAEGKRGYWTQDGCVGFTVFPRAELVAHLDWRSRAIVRDVGDDEGVNLWCIRTGRSVYKPLPGLVDHDVSVPSLDGHDHHAMRRPAGHPANRRR
jgi:hypothetical protein